MQDQNESIHVEEDVERNIEHGNIPGYPSKEDRGRERHDDERRLEHEMHEGQIARIIDKPKHSPIDEAVACRGTIDRIRDKRDI